MEDANSVAIEMTSVKPPEDKTDEREVETELSAKSENQELKADLPPETVTSQVADVQAEERVLSAEEKALFEAVANGDLNTLKKLKEEGADLELKNEHGNPLIHYAMKSGRSDIVAFLLEHQVNVNSTNKNGTSPLHLAAFSGHNEVIEMLYYAGANVNHQDSSGNTALHFSCQFNYPDTSMLLINCGSQLDLINSIGDVPLHGACRHNMLPVVMKMCEIGCLINHANGHNETPLHLAAKSGNCEIVRTLLLHGADLNNIDKDNKTPEDLVTNPEVLKLFGLYKQIMQSGSQNKKFEMRKQLTSSDKPLSRMKIAVIGNAGVGKTTFVESLKCGFIKSFLWSSYYTISKATKTSKDTSSLPNTNYTKGVSVENTNITDMGNVAVYDYSGLESYYEQYSLFLGDSSTVHLIVTSMKDSSETRYKQIDFWLEFIRIRMSPKEPIGFAGCNMWAPNVFIIATGADDTNSSKNIKGEWVLKDEESFLSPLLQKYERDVIINRPIFILDAQLPNSPEMKELKRTLSKLKTYIQNFLPTQMGCLDQTLLELPSLRTSLFSFPVMNFQEFAYFVREKVNLLASNDIVQELLVQLQLMGEIICFGVSPDEVIVLNPAWLGREIIGKLFSHETMIAHNKWSGFLSESYLKNVFQGFDFSRTINLLKALSICYERKSNENKEYYIHAYNRTEFQSSGSDWLEGRKSANLRGAVRLVSTQPVKDQLAYIFSHIISALHIVFIDGKCEFSQWKDACRVFEDGKTAIITLDNDAGHFTIMCHSTHEDASKLFTFCETICAVIFSSADQQCPGLFLQRLPAVWSECKNATQPPNFYEAKQILSDCLDSPGTATIQLNKDFQPESLVNVLAFSSEEAFKKFVISTEAHVSCLSHYAKCQLAHIIDRKLELCKELAQILKVDEQIVPVEPGSISIFDRLMSYWSTDATVTIRKLHEALKSCGAEEVIDMLLQVTPIYVYLPTIAVLDEN